MSASVLGSTGGAAPSPRRCCAKEGDAASRASTPLKGGRWLEAEEMEPPAAPRMRRVRVGKPPLLKAIENGSCDQVEAVLELGSRDAFLATFDFEPALCCAARTGQSEQLVRTLLRYGADVKDLSKQGRNALGSLCEPQFCRADSEESMGDFAASHVGVAWPAFSFNLAGFDGISVPVPDVPEVALRSNPVAESWQLRVGTLLLAVGAASDACDFTGATPAVLARKSGRQRLACLVEYYSIAQVMFVIGRVLSTGPVQRRTVPPVGRISAGILGMICGFLAPEGSEATLSRIGALLRRDAAWVRAQAF